jgi:hypothetical protein
MSWSRFAWFSSAAMSHLPALGELPQCATGEPALKLIVALETAR